MFRLITISLLLLLNSACFQVIDPADTTPFACETDADCPEASTCDLVSNLCRCNGNPGAAAPACITCLPQFTGSNCDIASPPTNKADSGLSGTAVAFDAGVATEDSSVPDSSLEDAGYQDAATTMDATTPAAKIVPLFDQNTVLEPELVENTPTALITRFADRGRDRHARENQFQAYEHYLPLYWENRTAQIEIVDTIGKGGSNVTVNVTTEWPLQSLQAELRFFFRGLNTVAEYFDNRPMTMLDSLNYTHEVSFNPKEGRAIAEGDRMEFELSQFLNAPPRGRSNYYGTTFLYVAGEGIKPWIGSGPNRDSVPLPQSAKLGGDMTIHENESDEPDFLFSQMPTNLAPQNGQVFVRGRRLVHTNFATGAHDESSENPTWTEQSGKLGPYYVNNSCNACHFKNGRAVPPQSGDSMGQYVVKIQGPDGNAHPMFGRVLQPSRTSGAGEPSVTLENWVEADGLRRPSYSFSGDAPQKFSVRISPQLLGMGLLEAIREEDVLAIEDPMDLNGDGISGRAHRVPDVETGVIRLGRFGYKASHATVFAQTASALQTDMGVLTSVFPQPECGANQADCGATQAELNDAELQDLTDYVALLGVPPQRDFSNSQVVAGADVFTQVGCDKCHVKEFVTSPYSRLAEVRNQTITPYTDLLLHDMGEGLADNFTDGDASGSEWRTAPLWGLGKTQGVSGAESYLHDGRARTIEEAILWHGGEGQNSKERYEALSSTDKANILAFLRSL